MPEFDTLNKLEVVIDRELEEEPSAGDAEASRLVADEVNVGIPTDPVTAAEFEESVDTERVTDEQPELVNDTDNVLAAVTDL